MSESEVKNARRRDARLQALRSEATEIVGELRTLGAEATTISQELATSRATIAALAEDANRRANNLREQLAQLEAHRADLEVRITAAKEVVERASQQEAAAAEAARQASEHRDSAGVSRTEVAGIASELQNLSGQASDQVAKISATQVAAEEALTSTRNAATSAETTLASARDSDTSLKRLLQSAEESEQSAKSAKLRIDAVETDSLKRVEALGNLHETLAAHEQRIAESAALYEATSKRIESLLPGATSAGLASSFKDQKESYDRPKMMFIGLLLATILVWLLAYIFAAPPKMTGTAEVYSWSNYLATTLYRLPILIPCTVLAWFAIRGYVTSDKMQQDYAYKERMSSAFDGFRQHFASGEGPRGGASPLTELNSKMLNILGQHPARFYDRHHQEDPPGISEVASSMIEGRNSTSTVPHQAVVNASQALEPAAPSPRRRAPRPQGEPPDPLN